MQTIPTNTKKQIVLSRVIYDYVINGLADSLNTLSKEDIEVFVMRVNMQAINHAIDISKQQEITDFDYCFDQLGVSFNISIPLSQIQFSSTFIDEHIDLLRSELGDDFEHMVTFLKKMEQTVV